MSKNKNYVWLGVGLLVVVLVLGMALGALVHSFIVKPSEEVVTEEVVQVETREGTYYFLAANNSDPFYIPGVKGFTDASTSVGMKSEFVGPMDLSLAGQMKTFEELVASPETKGIFWYPMDFNAGEPFVKGAVDKGIPMVIGAADSPFKTRNAFIGYNNTVLGQQAGAWVANLLDCKGKVGSVSVIGPNLEERKAGFYAYLANVCPDMEFVDPVTHDGSAENASQVLDAYMVANPDLDLVWFCDGGAGQQVQNWKEKQEKGVETLFLAMDMPPATLDAVKDGVFVGTVAQDTYTEAYWGVMLIDALSKGLRVPDTLYLSAIMIDKDNVDQFIEK